MKHDINLSPETLTQLENSVTKGVKRALYDYHQWNIDNISTNFEKITTGLLDAMESSLPQVNDAVERMDKAIKKL